MRALWSELPEACDSTLAIAERCEVTFAEGRDLMPRFGVPAGETEESWLVKEVERGLALRFPGGVPDQHRAQAQYEVGVVCQMGFPATSWSSPTCAATRRRTESGSAPAAVPPPAP